MDPSIELKHVSLAFDDKVVLKDVSFELLPGHTIVEIFIIWKKPFTIFTVTNTSSPLIRGVALKTSSPKY